MAEGKMLLNREQWRDAASEYLLVVKRDPKNAEAQRALAEAIYSTNFKRLGTDTYMNPATPAELAEAIVHLKAAVALQPNDWEGHLKLAEYLSDADRNREAVAQYRNALHLLPAVKPFDMRNGVMDGEIHRGTTPAAVWDPALQVWQINWFLGHGLSKIGQWHEAIRHYEVSLTFNPWEPYILLPYGYALEQTGQHRKALTAWETVVRTSTANSMYWLAAKKRLASYEQSR